MAKSRKRRRRSARSHRSRRRSYRRRSNPVFALAPRRRRRHGRRRNSHRRRRRNGSLRGFAQKFASGSTLKMIGGGAIGFFGARFIPQNIALLAPYNTGLAGYGLNAVAGGAVSYLAGKLLGPEFFKGGLIGTGLAIISRIVVEQGNMASGGGVNGDLDFDLGYYLDDAFPYRQDAAGGPYPTFPGNPRGAIAALPTSASAVRAAQGAAVAAASLPAAPGGWRGSARWPSR